MKLPPPLLLPRAPRPAPRMARLRRGLGEAVSDGAWLLRRLVLVLLLAVLWATPLVHRASTPVRLATATVQLAQQSTGQTLNPVQAAIQEVSPPQGSVAWKLRQNQSLNLLLLGYGGQENDAPWLTDSMMVVHLDPVQRSLSMVSIPRDLWVSIGAWPNHSIQGKINEAFEAGQTDWLGGGKLAQYSGRDGGGHLSEKVVGDLTGISFDGYIAVDFKAFRDGVDALGGVDVCLDTPLDDNQYPDYHDGYVRGGIHFPAGCEHVRGEQALEIARSRHADIPSEASDFARSRRQQEVMLGIRDGVFSANGMEKLPELMTALSGDFLTDLSLTDLGDLYSASKRMLDSRIVRLGLSDSDLLRSYYDQPGPCGPYQTYRLCAPDVTALQRAVQAAPTAWQVDVEGQPVQVIAPYEAAYRMSTLLKELGVQAKPAPSLAPAHTVIRDHSGGLAQKTVALLQQLLPGTQVVTDVQSGGGISVEVGRDRAQEWPLR